MLSLERVFKPSIYRRILGSFGIIIISILIVGALNVIQLTQFRALSGKAIPATTEIAVQRDYALALSSLDANLERLFVIGGGEIEAEILLNLKNMEEALVPMQASASNERLPSIEVLVETTNNLSEDTLLLIDLSNDRTDARTMNEQIIAVFEQIDLSKQLHEDLSAKTIDEVQNIIFTQEDIVINMISQVIALAFVASFIAVIATVFVSRSIAKPLFDVVQVAKQIAMGQLSSRAKVQSNDEIGQLANSFNAMADTIQVRENDLINLNQSLEQRVADRTIELEKARDEALTAQRIATENNRLKSEFLSMMSHELRTPMNAIEGFTSIMLNGLGGVEFNAQADDFIRRIQSNSKRLLALINDFLDLSRIESGRMELVHSPFSPRELVAKWQAEIGILADKKDISLEVNVASEIPETINGDTEALSKVVINLLSNAIKFTEKGKVTLSLECQDKIWCIIVEDTGIGIPPHAREYIFDEFRQVDQTSKRKYGGTGLGLAISQKIVRYMRGTISLESEMNQGSTFTVALPL